MIRVVVERFAYTPFGVFSNVIVVPTPGGGPSFSCFGIEDEEKNNAPGDSCIPRGTYDLQLGRYNAGDYPAYEVLNVPGRSLIKIHKGNTEDDVRGCLVVGSGLGFIKAKWAVTDSATAFTKLMGALQNQPTAQLIVQDIYRGQA